MKTTIKALIGILALASLPAASVVDHSPAPVEASTPAPAMAERRATLEADDVPVKAARDVAASSKPRRTRERFNPDPQHPTGKLIEVRLDRQRVVVWKDGKVIRRLTVSTGKPGWETPEGRFTIYAKVENGYASTWDVVLPWMLPFTGNYTFHRLTHPPGKPEQLNGRSQLGTPASHGCIRVDVGDAEWLYRFARIGTPVWIH